MLNAITDITIMTMTCLIPATYDPEPIFPAARPPKTPSIMAILNRADSSCSIFIDARDPNNPEAAWSPDASNPSWTFSISVKKLVVSNTETAKNTPNEM